MASSTSIPPPKTHAQIVNRLEMPGTGDELHHFGWNACSSCLCPNSAPRPCRARAISWGRGLRSSNPHPRHQSRPEEPQAVKVIEAKEIADRAATRAATRPLRARRHLRPAPSAAPRARRPAACGLIDPPDIRGAGRLGGSTAGRSNTLRHVVAPAGYDTVVTSEWGSPDDVRERPGAGACCSAASIGDNLHFWDLPQAGVTSSEVDFGQQHQLVFEPARRTTRPKATASSLRHQPGEPCRRRSGPGTGDGDKWFGEEDDRDSGGAADPDLLPPAPPRAIKACPPLVTDIDLSSMINSLCLLLGTGDSSSTTSPIPCTEAHGKMRTRGIVSRAGHPKAKGPLNGGPRSWR